MTSTRNWEENHLLYTDDLKLLGGSEGDLNDEIKIVKSINRNIKLILD